jgi:hypothetical protein
MGSTAIPVKDTFVTPPTALCEITISAFFGPSVSGLKDTLITQLPPDAMLLQLLLAENWLASTPPMVTSPTIKGPSPVFLTVNAWVEAVPTSWLGNATDVGSIVTLGNTGAAPVPCKLTAWSPALLLITSELTRDPVVVGPKVTVIVQLPLGGTGGPHVLALTKSSE